MEQPLTPTSFVVSPDDLTTLVQHAIRPVVDELDRVRAELRRMSARLERPDLQKYSVEEAAERLGRSRSGVYELIKLGELVPVRERGRTYLTEEECRRWERVQRAQ